MKITYYGTAAAEGVPAMFCDCEICKTSARRGGKNIRTRSQSLVDDKILIDFPADTYMHVINYGLPLSKIHTCLITHSHSAHLYPADFEMRCKGYAKLDDEQPLVLYATAAFANMIRAVQQGCNLIQDNRVLLEFINPFVQFEREGYKITPLLASHDKFSTPVIYILEKKGKCILYTHDSGVFPGSTWEYLENHVQKFNFVSFDCTFGTDDVQWSGHMSIYDNIKMRDRLTKIGCINSNTICCLNHFTHNNKPIYDEMVPLAEKEGFKVAYDRMTIEF